MIEPARGIYEHLITRELAERLHHLDPAQVQHRRLDPADAHQILTRHLAALISRALNAVPGGDDRLTRQVELANRLADVIAELDPGAADHGDQVTDAQNLLHAIAAPPVPPAQPSFPPRPATPLSTGALLVNGQHQPRIGHEVVHEMASADHVDLLCAFIKWHGLRIVEPAVRELIGRGGRLRVITTTYLGATDQRALDRLVELGAEVKVSYETRTTRLHAKAWLFRRANGTTTAYVGSSNLSRTALVDGVEWNVRIANLEQPHVIDTFTATFEDYWNDPAFEDYHPGTDADRLRVALRGERPDPASTQIANLDVRPYPYQAEILADLDAERQVHGRHRNLVVMATGTGKTVVAALDYRRLHRSGQVDSLLFVAHQEQILRQSLATFRQVMGDGSFGETLVAGGRPRDWRHVFASIQSLHRREVDPGAYDMVIVDEFHHAEAPTYARLLERLRPRVLLGLTATPDRADGGDVRRWFDGRVAVELHLWEALERQLLAPFQYFGVHDDVDLSHLRWKRGQGYDRADLEGVYTGNDARARLVLRAVRDAVDVGRMRALGFCVSIGHAEFMADWFTRHGVPSAAVTSGVGREAQHGLIRDFRAGKLRVLFTVDLFNEGVDLPMVDTVLMLRPTESATVFLQQLGRGLRLDDDKPCLTVLDFIGGQHANFRFDLRWRALTGVSRRAVREAVAQDFPTLPSGCHIQLDRVAKSIVLDNLRAALPTSRKGLVAELRQLGDVSLAGFLRETGLEVEDVYRSASVGGWAGLRRLAGVETSAPGPDDRELGRAIGRMLHLDDVNRLDLLARVAAGDRPAPGRRWDMLHFDLWGPNAPLSSREERLARLWAEPARCAELRQVVEVLRERIHRVPGPSPSSGVPLRVHARYSRNEACAAFGMPNPGSLREGVKWLAAERADLFFVTLVKSERHYSPTTMYADRAVTDRLFQWESQSTTSTASPTGQRYVHHAAQGSTVHLFLRESRVADGDLGAPPYLYAGPMTYREHTGDRPMRILWELTHPLPADVYTSARTIAA
ncbi:restriction endonuclease subunit R [Micromonospora echinospora]|uniref:ATP-dependent helicase IRC3 n=1 Tax=Micromonospora echinospora TaxID=1877 RepID=A0A1C4V0S3_MICEC|nr:DEAD/DEAH box helicase [Micromonospora echinospora]OZV82995.1 restriction endonuclease subunit R [Micromonospora echinospora]SCE77640.1 ATP-dependent helicase IRC3 [Micromonospora echinospora]